MGADPSVAAGTLDDIVGDHALVLGHHRIVEIPTDQTLDGKEGVGGVGHGLTLGRLADQAVAIVEEGDNGRRGARALSILDDPGGLAVHDGHTRIGGAKVNTNNLTHEICRSITGGRSSQALGQAPGLNCVPGSKGSPN